MKVWSYVILVSLLILGLSACQTRSSQTSSPGKATPTSVVEADESAPQTQGTRNYEAYEIVTLLPRDAIPAIDHPEFLASTEADSEYAPQELVIGVEFDGDARAYSIPFLSRHEIVNDTVGGVKLSVTW